MPAVLVPSASTPLPAPGDGADPRGSRQKILDVAETLFARRGFAGLGLREVAAAVGLQKSSLFHHFSTKRALYDEVLGRVLSRLESRLAPALTAPGGHARRLDLWIDAVVDALAEQPATARLAVRSLVEEDELDAPEAAGSALSQSAEATLERMIGGFRRLLAEGVADGVFQAVDAGHLTQTVIGATVFHFASSSFGEGVVGAPLFSAAEVARRKHEVKRLLRSGILSSESSAEESPDRNRRQ